MVIKKPLMSVTGNAAGIVQREGRGGTKVFNTLLSHRFHIQAADGVLRCSAGSFPGRKERILPKYGLIASADDAGIHYFNTQSRD